MTVTYHIEHRMRFRYTGPVEESVMTLYVCPLRDRAQLMQEFLLETEPDGALFEFTDPFGNTGHFFDRPRVRDELRVVARSVVELEPPARAPERLEPEAWTRLRQTGRQGALWPMLHPSRFVAPSPALEKFLAKHGIAPSDDPLRSTRDLCATLYGVLEYAPGETTADSPIDRILETGRGVCQDYAHVMAAILRGWGIPCRYVSGYLGPAATGVAEGESHAWVEAWFPGLGWIGFDPTNDTEGDARHVRVAVGRDYADVPPTRGTFRGAGGSVLHTAVVIERIDGEESAGQDPWT